MKWLKQLRWQIVASHGVVVLTGVLILLLTSQMMIGQRVTQLDHPNQVELLTAVNQSVLYALLMAALGALVAGIVLSLILTRQILKPLHEVGVTSQRIAGGHYDERVTLPDSVELRALALNFNQMAEALAQIEQKRVQLIANVSHELRNPLTGLEGYIEGLMDGVFPSNPETFAQMYQEVRRLRRLVNSLQTLSHVEARQITLAVEAFDITVLVGRVVHQLKPLLLAQNIQCEVQLLQVPLFIQADTDRVAQILVNLLGNAIRYTPEGGHIRVQYQLQTERVGIAIIDTGVGIPAEALPYLFERFYRVDPSRARNSGGSGIGLTISRHLAWMMGGDIAVTSPGLNLGSTFILTLPRIHS